MRSLLLATLCALPAPLFAQKPTLTARNFQFRDYGTVVRFDMKTLRDTGVWDELNTAAIAMTTKLFEDMLGFDLDRLDRVTMTRGPFGEASDRSFTQVTVLEGNGELEEPGDLSQGSFQTEAVGTHTLHVSQWGNSFARPTPKLHVYAPEAVLRQMLDEPQVGLPSADVMAFTAGQKNCLLHFVVDMKRDTGTRSELNAAMKASLEGLEWPEGDAPTMIGGRIRATGDEDDPHLMLEVVVRHGTVGDGLAASEKALNSGIEKLKKLSEARLFWPLLKKIESERDGTDAVWRVDLGRARNASGLMTTLTPFLFFVGTAEAQPVQVLQVEEVVVEEAPVAPKKEKPAQGGGK